MIEKKCSQCDLKLTADTCTPSVLMRGGMCRFCRKAYTDFHKVEIAARMKKYGETHKVERKTYLEKNKERISIKTKEYSRSDRGRHIQLKHVLRKENVAQSDPLWSINFYKALIEDKKCHYCLGPLNETSAGLDAIANEIGHVCFNVVPCCWTCNIIKMHTFTYDEMILLVPTLRLIQKQRGGL